MKKSLLALSLLAATSLGCASPLAGTWVADSTTADVNPIASVTFAEDGTYTAGAKYHGVARATSGVWSLNDGTLMLGQGKERRSYGCTVDGDRVTLSFEGSTSVMTRMKK